MLFSRIFYTESLFLRRYYIFFYNEHIKNHYVQMNVKSYFLFEKNNFIQFRIQETYIYHMFCTQKSESSRNQIFVYKKYGKCTFPEFETELF